MQCSELAWYIRQGDPRRTAAVKCDLYGGKMVILYYTGYTGSYREDFLALSSAQRYEWCLRVC